MKQLHASTLLPAAPTYGPDLYWERRWIRRERRWTRQEELIVVSFPLVSLTLPPLAEALFSIYSRFQTQPRSREQHGGKSPQIQAEILAIAVVALQFLQFVFFHERFRRGDHWLVDLGARAAYYAPVPLAAFAVGLMLRFRCPCWLPAIFFAAGQTDTMAAYSLDDDRQGVRRFAKRALSLAYLILASRQLGASYRRRPLEISSSLVLAVIVFVVDLKLKATTVPTSDLCMAAAEAEHAGLHNQKPSALVAEEPEPEPETKLRRRVVVALGSLESYRSAVSGRVTYQDILELNRSSGLEDACLSSALFLDMLRRCEATPQAAASSSSVNLVFRRLLREEENGLRGYARAMKLVEAQLSFIYDYFFSAHHGSPSHASCLLRINHSLLKLSFTSSILTLLACSADEDVAEVPEVAVGASVYAVHALILLQLCQLVDYLTSNWLLVSYMCGRARSSRDKRHASSLFQALDAVFEAGGSQGCSWGSKIGQYSLVEDFDRTSLMESLTGRLLGRRRRGASLSSTVALPQEARARMVRVAMRLQLQARPGGYGTIRALLHGTLSMLRLSPAEREIHTILILHVATWFCARGEAAEYRRPSLPGLREIATKISGYCAYLVAFHPELLPGNRIVTATIFDQAAQDAELCFEGATSPDERYRMMRSGDLLHSSSTGIFERGIELGRRLLAADSRLWAIMSDAWVETMLWVVASQGNAAAHIHHLAKGGEFVTHLWALLSNAGMLRENDDGSSSSREAYQDKGKEHAH